MFIIEVAPLFAIPRNQHQLLTYFSNQELPTGSAVEISVRNKRSMGIVFRSSTLKTAKISLRKEAEFSLKPIHKIISETPVLTSEQFRIGLWLSSQYFAPLGLCFKTVLPPFFGKKKYPIELAKADKDKKKREVEIQILRTTSLSRHYKDYQNLLEKYRHQQIFLLVPELPYLDYFKEHYKFFQPEIVHSRIEIKKLYDLHQKIKTGAPLLVIGTRVASFLPFKNLGLIILDNASNNTSRSDTTPRYASPDLTAYLAKEYGADLIINDLVPSIEDSIYDHSFLENRFQLPYSHPPLFVNLVEEIQRGRYSIFSRELEDCLLETARRGGKSILFVPRRGYASSLVCQGCSQDILCPNCRTSLVVHDLPGGKRVLKCHHCQREEGFIKVCPSCHNFMLEYKGLGTQKVIKKLKDLFRQHNQKEPFILELSSDSAPRETDEQTIISAFKSPGASILVATQKILSWQYLLKSNLMGIVNIALSANFPDFRTEEQTLRWLATLGQMADQTVIQGYRDPDSSALKAFLENDFCPFFKVLENSRKLFFYPPFSELIKLKFRHKNFSALQEARVLSEKLKQEIKVRQVEKGVVIVGPHPALLAKEKGGYSWNIVLKVKNLDIKERNELLRLVPSRNWSIEVNPKEIL